MQGSADRRLVRLLATVGWLCLSAWTSQAQAEGSASLLCEPACRSGFECQLGECVSICNPPCRSGRACLPTGECAPASPRSPRDGSETGPDTPSGVPPNGCLPACRVGFVCIDSACVTRCNPPCPGGRFCTAEGECAVGAPPAEPFADAFVNLHLNALGPLQFGLSPTIELGGVLSAYLSLTFPNTGLLPYLLFPEGEGDFVFGLAATVGMHLFSADKGTMRGFYGGIAVGYAFTHVSEETFEFGRYYTHSVVPQLDFGHRWAFGRFLLGLGVRGGVAIPVLAVDRPTTDPGCLAFACDGERPVVVLGSLVLDVGVFL